MRRWWVRLPTAANYFATKSSAARDQLVSTWDPPSIWDPLTHMVVGPACQVETRSEVGLGSCQPMGPAGRPGRGTRLLG
jgi:hypothetical protein